MPYLSRYHRATSVLSVEELERRLCLTEVPFDVHDVTVGEFEAPPSVLAADLDGDGDADVLSSEAYDNTIAWYENVDGQGRFRRQVIIKADGTQRHRMPVHVADVDGDGDLDVLSKTLSQKLSLLDIVWYENTDGRGTFGPPSIVTSMYPHYDLVRTADVDGDGDLDVLLTRGSGSGQILSTAWYENIDGKGNFGPGRLITENYKTGQIHVVDLDGDGDVDLIAELRRLDETRYIAWYENTDGKGSFVFRQSMGVFDFPIHGPYGVHDVYPADLDGDGDVDLLALNYHNVVWFENTDGQGRFSQERVVSVGQSSAVGAADVDGDGDLDILVSSYDSDRNTIAWHDNIDGSGSFGQQQVIGTMDDKAYQIPTADLDGDGDVDILASLFSWQDPKLLWYENLSPQIAAGDANRDLRFDQLDIAQVFQAGKYLIGEPATWDEGDWNLDGVFDQLDIVTVLQMGHYLQGPYEAVDRLFSELVA